MSLRHLQLIWSHEGDDVVVSLRGDIDLTATEVLPALVTVAETSGGLVVDLAGVTFLDLSGVEVLDALAARDGISMRNPSIRVVRILERLAEVGDAGRALRDALAE